jgi:ABC-type Fe3+-hydroxamate transport system substrate-binding protein
LGHSRSRRRTRLAALLASIVLAACGARVPSTGALVAVDDAGDTVRLVRPAARIVSLIPATTELLFALGAGQQVVGRTHYCDYPAEAARVTDLGEGINPSLEAIVARQPDLVILYQSVTNRPTAQRLRQLGIEVLELRTDSLSTVPRLSRLLGRLTGHGREADSVSVVFARELAAATVTPRGPRPSVFNLVWEQPPMTVGRGSFLNEVMERAGARNAFDDLGPSAAPISIEAVAARNPDVVLTVRAGAGDTAMSAFVFRPEWQAVPAVRERRLIRIAGSEFNRPSPRAPLAVRELAALLQGRGR